MQTYMSKIDTEVFKTYSFKLIATLVVKSSAIALSKLTQLPFYSISRSESITSVNSDSVPLSCTIGCQRPFIKICLPLTSFTAIFCRNR